MTQVEWNGLISDYQDRHPTQKKVGGFAWKDAAPFEGKWSKLPGWPMSD